jgi:hypothetical protein
MSALIILSSIAMRCCVRTETANARGAHHEAEERTKPQRWSADSPGVRSAVIDCHVILLDPRDDHWPAWDGGFQRASSVSDESLGNGVGMQDDNSANDREKIAEFLERRAHLAGWGRGLTPTQSKMPLSESWRRCCLRLAM